MKTIKQILCMLILSFTFFQCQNDDEIVPMQPTQPEKPATSDTLNVGAGSANADNFSIIGEKSNETTSGYDVKGDLYLETDSGKVAIFEGAAFSVVNDAQGNLESIEGTGPVNLPDLGMFSSFTFPTSTEAAFVYNTGKYFKDTNPSFSKLPLRDTSYYFFFNLLNLAPDEWQVMSVKNANIGVTNFFMNLPQEEIIISTGNFEFSTPTGPVKIGNELTIGISAKGSFPFTPTTYADSALNATIEKQQAFSDVTGFLYLAGNMSVKETIPMKLAGNAVIKGEFDDFFTNGFGASSLVMAMNGKLLFGHDLLDLLPVGVETELTNVTFRADQTYQNGKQTGAGFKFAGEFDDNAWMETIIDAIAGKGASQYVPLTGNEGSMFASFGSEIDDWELYVRAAFAVNTPHLGKQEARHGVFHVTSEKLGISAGMGVPFVPGEMFASGEFGFDGNIHLKGQTKGGLKMNDVSLASDLTVDIYNDSTTLKGNITVPYDIGKVDVKGKINQSGLSLNGTIDNQNMSFGSGIMLPVAGLNLSAAISSTHSYLNIAGKIVLLQLNHPVVEVAGNINNKGLELTGKLDTHIAVQKGQPTAFNNLPFANASVTARTWEGVKFTGQMEFPFGLGKVNTTGVLTSRKDYRGFPEIRLNADFSSNPTLNVHGFSYPTAGMTLFASSVDGIQFEGQVKFIDKLGWGTMRGEIAGNSISFSGSINQTISFGGKALSSSLKYSAGNNLYPNIADISGSISTPFGSVNVSGVVGLNGGFSFSGTHKDCHSYDLVFEDISVKTFKYFTFKNTGVTFGGEVYVCEEVCDKAENCVGVFPEDLEISADWSSGSFKLCFPDPTGIGEICL